MFIWSTKDVAVKDTETFSLKWNIEKCLLISQQRIKHDIKSTSTYWIVGAQGDLHRVSEKERGMVKIALFHKVERIR